MIRSHRLSSETDGDLTHGICKCWMNHSLNDWVMKTYCCQKGGWEVQVQSPLCYVRAAMTFVERQNVEGSVVDVLWNGKRWTLILLMMVAYTETVKDLTKEVCAEKWVCCWHVAGFREIQVKEQTEPFPKLEREDLLKERWVVESISCKGWAVLYCRRELQQLIHQIETSCVFSCPGNSLKI